MAKQTSILQSEIDTKIYANGQQLITGPIMHDIVSDMVSNDWLIDADGNRYLVDPIVSVGISPTDLLANIPPYFNIKFATMGDAFINGRFCSADNPTGTRFIINSDNVLADWTTALIQNAAIDGNTDGSVIGIIDDSTLSTVPYIGVFTTIGGSSIRGDGRTFSLYAGVIFDSDGLSPGTSSGPQLPGLTMQAMNNESGNVGNVSVNEFGLTIHPGYLKLSGGDPTVYMPSGGEVRYTGTGFQGFNGSTWVDFGGGSVLPGGSNYQTLTLNSGNSPEFTFALSSHDGVDSIDYDNRIAYDGTNAVSVHWGNRVLEDTGTLISIEWDSRRAFDSSNGISIDWNNRQLLYNSITVFNWSSLVASDGAYISIDWGNRLLSDSAGLSSLLWGSRLTADSSNIYSINWQDRRLLDTSGNPSADWASKLLMTPGGTTIFDWSNNTYLINAPLVGQVSTTSAAPSSAAGVGATATLYAGSNDSAGLVTLNTTILSGLGGFLTITLGVTLPHIAFAQLTPGNAAAAAVSSAVYMSAGPNSIEIACDSASVIQNNTTYEWYYQVHG